MNPGKLRHRITLQTKQQDRDGLGQPTTSWQSLLPPVWGDAWIDLGDEQKSSLRVDSKLTGSVVIRWRSDVKPDMRLLWNEQQYEITAVADLDGRRRYLRIWIKRHV